MEQRGAALRTGLFVLAGIVVVIGMIFLLSGNAFRAGIEYESYFSESVQGLDVGSAVKFRGVAIGKVTDIGLVSAEYPPPNEADLVKPIYHQVVVRFRVDPRKLGPDSKFSGAIAHGLRVQVAPQGITGLAYLELSFVSPANHPVPTVPWHPRSMVIPSVPSTLTQVQDAVQTFLTNMSGVKFDQTIKVLTSLVGAINQELTTGDAHQAVANANDLLDELKIQVQQADLPATAASIRNLADGAKTQAILGQLDRASTQLAQATAAMPKLLAQTQATISGANQTTATLTRQMIPILRNLNQASSNLDELSETLKNNPAAVLRGGPPPPETPR
ncbi:MAG: MlaD family protein [Acidiphilium sp.]|nr:MlaD family protein [Acidiphilium sp.]MDD4934512.1 MlaD family protein [Acidiphilium sp.]